MLRTLTAWVALAGFYLLFAGQISVTEIIAGVPATLACAGFAVLLHGAQSRRLRLRAPWPRMVLMPLAALLPDVAKVGGVLVRALWRRPSGTVGVVSRQPFRHGGDGDAGRRALSTLGLSLAPNGYVLTIPDGQDAMVLHRLAPAAADPDPEWPA